MDKEQYEFVNQYREVIEHFVSHQTYVGGADGLFLKYLTPTEMSCSSCKSACMIQRYNELKQYELQNL